MEFYTIIKKNNLPRKVHKKSLAFTLMSEMNIGEKLYFDVTHERAIQWCRIFERGQWRRTFRRPYDNPNRRHLVKFKILKEGSLRCIKKIDDREVYTNYEHIANYKKFNDNETPIE